VKKLTCCGLLALSLAMTGPPAARAQGGDPDFMEPHQLMKARFEAWQEGQRLASGYYRYEFGDGRYPGPIFYRQRVTRPRPAGGSRWSLAYRRSYALTPADVRPRPAPEVYRLRTAPLYRGYRSPRPRISDSAPSGAGSGLSGGR
jgi:hypothetical protein